MCTNLNSSIRFLREYAEIAPVSADALQLFIDTAMTFKTVDLAVIEGVLSKSLEAGANPQEVQAMREAMLLSTADSNARVVYYDGNCVKVIWAGKCCTFCRTRVVDGEIVENPAEVALVDFLINAHQLGLGIRLFGNSDTCTVTSYWTGVDCDIPVALGEIEVNAV